MGYKKDERYNDEGYIDIIPYSAIKGTEKRNEAKFNKLLKSIQTITHLAGFEIVGRVVLKDKETGDIYK